MNCFAIRAVCASALSFTLFACSSAVTTDSGTDAAADVVGTDSALDAPHDVASDLANDTANDVATDVPADIATDAPSACSPTMPCHAFWCGCGSCNPADIICVSDDRGCPLGCVSSCPEVDTTVCSCNGGACTVVHVDGGTDAGTDASADASSDGGGPGTPCSATSECAGGLMCCYPCGIPGCHNQCLTPIGGSCPLFP